MIRFALLALVGGCSLYWNAPLPAPEEAVPDATVPPITDGTTDAAAEVWTATYVKDPAPRANDYFGYAVALSTDGQTLAVGAIEGFSNGYVDVFARAGTWTRQARLTAPGGPLGSALSLSADGSILAAGAYGSNAVFVFTRTGTTWSSPVTVATTTATDQFGWSVALDADGSRLAVGARGENGNAGAAYLFTHGTTWTQTARLAPTSPSAFGHSVTTSADGATVAVGAPGAGGTGAVYVFVDGVQQQMIAEYGPDIGNKVGLSADGNTLMIAARNDNVYGAIYIYKRSGSTWTKAARMEASNPYIPPGPTGIFNFGSSAAMSKDAMLVVGGAFGESSKATGLDGDQSDHSAMNAGAAYMFQQANGGWPQTHYVKATNTDAFDGFAGYEVALDGTGHVLAVGAPYEQSGGPPADNSATGAGAVYVYSR